MHLRFTRTADYGLRAALEIAGAPAGQLVTRRSIARATNAPASVLAQALAPLVRAGVLVAQAGPRGGYSMARDPGSVSIYEVVRSVDGEEPEQRCVLRESVCSSTGSCPFHAVLMDAQERFVDTLKRTSLADVLAHRVPTRDG